MSAQDDRDLAAAFEELAAPPSTANYATRTSVPEIRTSRARWPQALASALAVLVAVAGAGTFLALRNARQGGSPSSSAGTPPARLGAAMAFDSTADVTVMFGGTDRSGRSLNDTWTWNGAMWTPAASGPRSLTDVRMVDDPADGGLLLMGNLIAAGDGSGASGGIGCVVGSSGSTGGGGSTGNTTAPATSSPGRFLVHPTGPVVAPPPTAVAPPPVSSCQPMSAQPAVSDSVQTWLFSNGSWNRGDSGSGTTSPASGSQLAFDATTRQVVAVLSPGFGCLHPLEAPTDTAIACPAMGNSTSAPGAALPGAPCGALLGCLTNGTLSTWTWSHGGWLKLAASDAIQSSGVTLVFDDPATNHATLMIQAGAGWYGATPALPPACATGESCGSYAPSYPAEPGPFVTTWTWTGSGWRQLSKVQDVQVGPAFAGATVATVGGHIVVLTTTGQTWTFAAGQWTQDSPSRHPSSRQGAAIAAGPGGTVVLFGGAWGLGVAAMPGALGSDTWVWNGTAWKQEGGTAPAAPPVNPCTAVKNATGTIPPCAPQPLPAQVAPAAPAGTPAASATP